MIFAEIKNLALTEPNIALVIITLVGLIVGSFLNVVIYRLPIMLMTAWKKECKEYFSLDIELEQNLNIVTPRSRCPQCKQLIRWWQNIPLISFILLKGKCGNCKQKISWRYPTVELLTAIVTVAVAAKFGLSMQTLCLLILSWCLLAASFIDLEHKLIPDELIYLPLWLGLAASCYNIFQKPCNAIIGVIVGYIFLWSIYWIFKLITNKEGMGYADFKLLAMLGAWVGWQNQLLVILISSTLGAVIGGIWILQTKQSRNFPIPFGPFLAIAGWITIMWEKKLHVWYYAFKIDRLW